MSGRICPRPAAILCCSLLLFCVLSLETSAQEKPLILLSILARNQAYTLPNFLGYIEQLDYPKNRIAVWIRTDHNEDNTTLMLQEWMQNIETSYASIDFEYSDAWLYPSFDPFEMSDERYLHIAKLRQGALDAARSVGADYLFSVDCDNFLVNNQTLSILIGEQKPIIAPMLETGKDSAYSNFWCAQDKREERVGCFQVPVIHSTLLVDLRSEVSKNLVYWPAPEGFTGPVDDVVQFAYSAKKEGLGMYVVNSEFFGYMLKPYEFPSVQEAAEYFFNVKMATLVNHPPVPVSEYLSVPVIPKDNIGLDAVFMISLARRTDRRTRMLACLNELSFNYTLFDAVDGKELNQTYIDDLGIQYLPGWKDPWGARPMTFGEVGCFLSHYFIWQRMLSEGLQQVLVLEDDIDFESYFKLRLKTVLDEAQLHTPDWDLIYVGRKALYLNQEKLVPGTTVLVKPVYSYWTLSYLISQSGAKKLIEARPFDNLLPVDEYFPIMFNEHPEYTMLLDEAMSIHSRKEWAAHFKNRDLHVYSAYPLLAFPTHYVGDEGWFSDTEPPIEVLQQIRRRKIEEEKKLEETLRQEKEHQKKIKEQAQKRIIESMRAKLKQKSEL